jgi:hypothetical protein
MTVMFGGAIGVRQEEWKKSLARIFQGCWVAICTLCYDAPVAFLMLLPVHNFLGVSDRGAKKENNKKIMI